MAPTEETETQISTWRSYLTRGSAMTPTDADELEGHLRDQIDALEASGLSADEAFLVAVKRMGALDEVSREFAREHSDRLWKQLVVGEPAAARAGLERPDPRDLARGRGGRDDQAARAARAGSRPVSSRRAPLPCSS